MANSLLPLNRLAKTAVGFPSVKNVRGRRYHKTNGVTQVRFSPSLPKGAASALQIVRNGMCVCVSEKFTCVCEQASTPDFSLCSFRGFSRKVDFFRGFFWFDGYKCLRKRQLPRISHQAIKDWSERRTVRWLLHRNIIALAAYFASLSHKWA